MPDSMVDCVDHYEGTCCIQAPKILAPPHTKTLLRLFETRRKPMDIILNLFFLKLVQIEKEHSGLRNSNRARRILEALELPGNEDIKQTILADPRSESHRDTIEYAPGILCRLNMMANYSKNPPAFGGEEAKAAYHESPKGNPKHDPTKRALRVWREKNGENAAAKAWHAHRKENGSSD